eukprot:CCRYP_008034-RA/>CCRYP_008034-RA protein AED:0.84 eAED:0.71 QI:0/0/0/0.33/1/1/3/0/609
MNNQTKSNRLHFAKMNFLTFDDLISCIDESLVTCTIGSVFEFALDNNPTTEAPQPSNDLASKDYQVINPTSKEDYSQGPQLSSKSPLLSAITSATHAPVEKLPSTFLPTEVVSPLLLSQQQDHLENDSYGIHSSVEEADHQQVESTLTSPTFSFEGPFVTIEIKFSDKPSGIGWSLLSSDGTINIAKPPGTYSSYKPTATVYEAVSLDNGVDEHQLTVTLSNTYGTGLCCSGGNDGYFAIYNGQPQSSNLLVHGGEFEYFVMLSLFLSSDGMLHELKEYISKSDNADVTLPTSTNVENDGKPGAFSDGEQSDGMDHTDPGETESANTVAKPESGLNSKLSEQEQESSPKLESHKAMSPETHLGVDYGTSNFQTEPKQTSKDSKAVLIPVLMAAILFQSFLKSYPVGIDDFEDENSSICSGDTDFGEETSRFNAETKVHVEQIDRKSTLSETDLSTSSNTGRLDENVMTVDAEFHSASSLVRYSEDQDFTDHFDCNNTSHDDSDACHPEDKNTCIQGYNACDPEHMDHAFEPENAMAIQSTGRPANNGTQNFNVINSNRDADALCLAQAALEDAINLFDDRSNDLVRRANVILQRLDDEMEESEGDTLIV